MGTVTFPEVKLAKGVSDHPTTSRPEDEGTVWLYN